MVAIDAVDTRALVAHIRNRGAMNCIVSSEITDIGTGKTTFGSAIDERTRAGISCQYHETYDLGDEGSAIRIAVLDFGVKKKYPAMPGRTWRLCSGLSYKTGFDDLENSGQQVISSVMVPVIPPRWIMPFKRSNRYRLPATLFGICLGHQLLALANDISTFKMHHGHRGLNHPVRT